MEMLSESESGGLDESDENENEGLDEREVNENESGGLDESESDEHYSGGLERNMRSKEGCSRSRVHYFQPIAHIHAGNHKKKTFYEQTACLCAKNKSSKVQKFLPSASRRKSSESVLLLIHVQGQQPATFVYLCWD